MSPALHALGRTSKATALTLSNWIHGSRGLMAPCGFELKLNTEPGNTWPAEAGVPGGAHTGDGIHEPKSLVVFVFTELTSILQNLQ